MSMEIHNQHLKNLSNKLSYKDLIIFLIPFTIFMVYLYIFNPGILRPDTFNQFHQIATSTFGNWHPFFYIFIVINEKNKEKLGEVLTIAYTDSLTGVKSRHAFVEEEIKIDEAIAKRSLYLC